MPTYYVRSTDGNNADSGATWALAKADLHTPTWALGDVIYVSQAHAQSTGSGITIASNGTPASPTLIIGGNDAAEPPTALSSAPTVTTTSNFAITITGSVYCYGLNFFSGSGASSGANLTMNGSGSVAVFEQCSFQAVSTNGSNDIVIGSPASSTYYKCTWSNCDVKFAAAAQTVSVTQSDFQWNGGSALSGGTTPTALFALGTTGDGASAVISGVDFSNLGTGFNLFEAGPDQALGIIRNCKFPASWSGSIGVPTGPAQRYEMYNCDSGDTNYRLWISDYSGTVREEPTVVRTGGASDGTTPLAWKIVTTANAKYPSTLMRSGEIVQWNDTTGSSVTATVEIVHDSQGAGSGSKFQDDEIWLEVMYLGTSGYPLGSWIRDCKADVLAAAANQTDSTETWTTTGLTSPVKQKLSVTFTPQEKGFIHARVVMAKASKTCYVCPKMTVA